MAQPNQPPPSTGQRMLEFILDRQPYRLQNSLLGNLNLLDYMNLRHLTRRILHSLDPVVLQTQNLQIPPPAVLPNPPAVPLGGMPGPPPVAPPLAPPGPQIGPPIAIPGHPQAAPQNNPTNFLRRTLGAHCDDTRRVGNVLNVQAGQQQIPCPNGPTAMVRMRPCVQPNPQTHPPFPTQCFNVCDDCLRSWRFYHTANITNHLLSRRSILCKRCSLSLRRRHRRGHNACTCRQDILTPVNCHSCRPLTELPTLAAGDARRHTLQRTHVKRTGTGARRRRSLPVDDNPDTVRIRPACATPNCGRRAWTRHPSKRDPGVSEPHFSMHDKACLRCLCCGGEYVP